RRTARLPRQARRADRARPTGKDPRRQGQLGAMSKAGTSAAARPSRTEQVDFNGLSAIVGFVVHLANLLLYRDFYERFAGNTGGLSLGAISVMAVIDANPGIRQ